VTGACNGRRQVLQQALIQVAVRGELHRGDATGRSTARGARAQGEGEPTEVQGPFLLWALSNMNGGTNRHQAALTPVDLVQKIHSKSSLSASPATVSRKSRTRNATR
jgi:hypothetical protein